MDQRINRTVFKKEKVTVRQVRRVLKIVIYEAVLDVYNGITIRLISKGDICRIRVARKKVFMVCTATVASKENM